MITQRHGNNMPRNMYLPSYFVFIEQGRLCGAKVLELVCVIFIGFMQKKNLFVSEERKEMGVIRKKRNECGARG